MDENEEDRHFDEHLEMEQEVRESQNSKPNKSTLNNMLHTWVSVTYDVIIFVCELFIIFVF